ncbi:MAG: trypsin-like peptidase domain-containing protein [Chloroflexota bacterium]
MRVERWLKGLCLFLVVALLALAGFTEQLYSRQGQLSQRVTALEGESSQRIAEFLAQITQVEEGLSRDLATKAGELESADAALSQNLSAQSKQFNTDIASAQAKLQGLQSQFNTDIASAQARLQGLQSQLQTTQGQTEAADAALKKQIQDAIVSLQGQMQTADAALREQIIEQIQAVDFSQLYARVRDSIVEIRVSRPTSQGTGAGFLYGAGGQFIVTAYHVIEGATQINVVPSSGNAISATLVGGNSVRDVALLRLSQPLTVTPLSLGDSALVKVGHQVMVVGSPFGETASASTGVVSGVNRQETWDGKSGNNMVQFDAAANPGNSGGPLLNAQGEVIGLVVSRIDPAEGSGVSFAVPASTVKAIIDPLLK